MSPKLTAAQVERLEVLVRAGVATSAIAAELRCSARTVNRRRQELGVAPPEYGPPAERIVELALQGWSTLQIAAELGVSDGTVRAVRRRRGCSAAKQGLDPDKVRRVGELTRQGWTTESLCVELGMSDKTVVRYRRAAGVLQPTPQWFTAEELELADKLLADGCSYAEAARTLGRPGCATSLRLRFPGRGWDAATTGAFNRALRLLNPDR